MTIEAFLSLRGPISPSDPDIHVPIPEMFDAD